MELLDIQTLGFLVFFGFMASFIDSVVGGGGLISIPALMWTGLPPVTVLGTNKAAAVMGALTSFVAFVKSGKVDMWLIKRLFPLSLIGSGLGVLAVRLVPPDILRPLGSHISADKSSLAGSPEHDAAETVIRHEIIHHCVQVLRLRQHAHFQHRPGALGCHSASAEIVHNRRADRHSKFVIFRFCI